MDSRNINRIENCMGLNMFIFKDGSVMNANEISVSLFEEVMLLRMICDSENLERVNHILDEHRSQKQEI